LSLFNLIQNMPDSQLPSPTDSSDALTLMEKLVEVRLLILALAFLFYLDIWALHANVNPMTLTAEQLGRQLQAVPVFQLALFFASFSILMGAFFPAARVIYGGIAALLGKGKRFTREDRPPSAKRLSDWSLGFVAFSLYDAVVGWFSTGSYRGLALYLTQLLEPETFELTVFRLTTILFWVVCFILAVEVDR
jgi:hypothetical protein